MGRPIQHGTHAHSKKANPSTAKESTTVLVKVTRGADEGSKPETAVLPLEHYTHIAYTFTGTVVLAVVFIVNLFK